MNHQGRGNTSRDIIAIGASAGGIEPLLELVRQLPANLPAAVFIVVHTPAHATSRLPNILHRAAALPAAHAEDGEAIERGRIYVAPPDRHLLIRDGTVEVSRGPRENHSRPAIDPLFRSAARSYGSRAVGIVLSGALYDGAAGLLAIKERGGLAIVQDPDEAAVSSMPSRALRLVDADLVLPARAIGEALAQLSLTAAANRGDDLMMDDDAQIEAVIANDFADQASSERADEQSVYTCPDCGGVLWQSAEGRHTWFRCHVGHRYAPEVLLELKADEIEAALWSCVRLLREKATLTRQSVARYQTAGNERLAARAEEMAQSDEHQAEVLRELLQAIPSPIDVPLSALAADENGRGSGTAPT